jgi:pyruvate dehydrogenase E2 component (dihydrolipoamide acetyltransferase)
MPQTVEVKVPDIGDFTDIPVIEVLVKAGDSVKAEDSLITLESDKATMDVPAPTSGMVRDVKVKIGDKVSEGKVILTLETADAGSAKPSSPPPAPPAAAPAPSLAAAPTAPSAVKETAPSAPASGAPRSIEVKVPDIGDFKDVPVIEVLVKAGDTVKAEDSLITLESEKATMDVPSPSAGVIREVKVKLGDKVSEGHVIATIESTGAPAQSAPSSASTGTQSAAANASPALPSPSAPASSTPQERPEPAAAVSSAPIDKEGFRNAHASPSVRALARELGVDLARVKGTGPKDRVLLEDVQKFVKQVMSGATASTAQAAPSGGGAALGLLPWPQIDFTKFGPTETKPLSRIKKISGANLHRNWVMIPHVTNHDDADITELEALRVTLNKENEKAGIKITMLAFLIKVCVSALKKFPEFNASLVNSVDGDNLIFKQYYNIGFAADTPNGLMVPVVKNADQKGVLAIAKEMGDLSSKAREGKLGPADMQGGCFSISSLGGIGGTYFSPIINAPEVAILGVCRSTMRPVWDGKQFVPRLILPLSLSYDHRVVDGAAAARFNSYLISLLGDMRRSLL